MIFFVDVETTGLEERSGHLLEVAVVATDDDLLELAYFTEVVRPVGPPVRDPLSQRLHPVGEEPLEPVCDHLLDVDPFRPDADLPAVDEARPRGRFGRAGEVGRLQDHEGRLPAQLGHAGDEPLPGARCRRLIGLSGRESR